MDCAWSGIDNTRGDFRRRTAESPYIDVGAVDDAASSLTTSPPRSGYHHDGPDAKCSNKEHVNGAVLSGNHLVVLGESHRTVQAVATSRKTTTIGQKRW